MSLLVPACVFGLLVVLILPAVQQARETARRTQAKNTFKQWGLAVHNYADSYGGVLPLGANVDADGIAHHGWPTRLIPYLAATPLYNDIDMNQPWDSPVNEPLMRGRMYDELSLFISAPVASPEGYGLIHYAANPNVMHRNHCITFKDMTAGTSETFLFGEAGGDFLPWGYPFNWRPLQNAINESPVGYGLPSRQITFFTMADGSVRSISPDIDQQLLQAWGAAPPIATPEQAELPPRQVKFRSTGAKRELLRVGSYRADVRIHPDTQEISVTIDSDKLSEPDDVPNPTNIRSAIVSRFPQCTSLSVPIPLNRALAMVLSGLPNLSRLEVNGLIEIDDVIPILKTLNKLTSIRLPSLNETAMNRLRHDLPNVRILLDPP